MTRKRILFAWMEVWGRRFPQGFQIHYNFVKPHGEKTDDKLPKLKIQLKESIQVGAVPNGPKVDRIPDREIRECDCGQARSEYIPMVICDSDGDSCPTCTG